MKSRSLVFGTAVALIAATLAGCAEQGGKNANVDDARLCEFTPEGAARLSDGLHIDQQLLSSVIQSPDYNVKRSRRHGSTHPHLVSRSKARHLSATT